MGGGRWAKSRQQNLAPRSLSHLDPILHLNAPLPQPRYNAGAHETGECNHLKITSDGALLSASADGKIVLWPDAITQGSISNFQVVVEPHPGGLIVCQVRREGGRRKEEGTLAVFRVAGADPTDRSPLPPPIPPQTLFQDEFLISGDFKGKVKLWSKSTDLLDHGELTVDDDGEFSIVETPDSVPPRYFYKGKYNSLTMTAKKHQQTVTVTVLEVLHAEEGSFVSGNSYGELRGWKLERGGEKRRGAKRRGADNTRAGANASEVNCTNARFNTSIQTRPVRDRGHLSHQ